MNFSLKPDNWRPIPKWSKFVLGVVLKLCEGCSVVGLFEDVLDFLNWLVVFFVVELLVGVVVELYCFCLLGVLARW